MNSLSSHFFKGLVCSKEDIIRSEENILKDLQYNLHVNKTKNYVNNILLFSPLLPIPG